MRAEENKHKQLIIGELVQQKVIGPDEEPPKPCIAAAPYSIDLHKFTEVMPEHRNAYSGLDER